MIRSRISPVMCLDRDHCDKFERGRFEVFAMQSIERYQITF